MAIAPKLELVKHTEQPHHHDCFMFPDEFLWGTSVSAHQVEGNNSNSDWWHWEQQPGRIKDGTKSGQATDHYNRFEKDFDLAEKIGANAQRLSIEWARIEPEPGQWDQAAIEHYRQVLTNLKKRDLKIMLTLYHFTLPQWFAERGGWLHRDAKKDFCRFTQKIVAEFGELVDFWLTINEPMVYATQSYTYAVWPPQKSSSWLTGRVVLKLARAHARAYKIIHRAQPDAQVGYANNMMSMETYNKHSLLDFFFMFYSSWIWNHAFNWLSGFKHHDFIGINYYIHQRIKREGLHFIRFIDNRGEAREHSDMGWEIYPNGLFQVIVDMSKYKLPIYITENGIAAENDHRRCRYLVAYISQIHYALKQGADVRGYFHWSLLDNFEWAEGFAMRFGLIQVDYKTLKRTLKESARVFHDIASENAICHRLLKYLGHGVTYKQLKKM